MTQPRRKLTKSQIDKIFREAESKSTIFAPDMTGGNPDIDKIIDTAIQIAYEKGIEAGIKLEKAE